MLSTSSIGQEVVDQGITPGTSSSVDAPDTPEIVNSSVADAIESADIESLVRYVSDVFFVPLRETPCARCKIVHRGIKSGTKIELLDNRDGWGLVSTAKGYQGWMPEQFVIPSPAAKDLLLNSEEAYALITSENKELLQEIGLLKQQVDGLLDAVKKAEYDKNEADRRLSEVVGLSSSPVALNNQNQALVKQNHILQTNNDVLIADIEILENDQRNQSFIYGGLTVVMGALLAALIPKLRGRKKFSEWG